MYIGILSILGLGSSLKHTRNALTSEAYLRNITSRQPALIELAELREPRLRMFGVAIVVGTAMEPCPSDFSGDLGKQRERLADQLTEEGFVFDVVISSDPCYMQTAQVLAKRWEAEVLGFSGPETWETKTSNSEKLEEKLRYAKWFLKSLVDSRHFGKSSLWVTSAVMLQVCASLLPAIHFPRVISLEPLATLAACCDGGEATKQEMSECECRSQWLDSFRSNPLLGARDAEHQVEQLNDLLRDAKVASCYVLLQGVTMDEPSPKPLECWQDLQNLLLDLPDLEFDDEKGDPSSASSCSFPSSASDGSSDIMLREASNSFKRFAPPVTTVLAEKSGELESLLGRCQATTASLLAVVTICHY